MPPRKKTQDTKDAPASKFGLGRLVLWAILGPVILYFALFGHIACRANLQEPEPIRVADFPQGMGKAQVDKVVAGRKQLIAEFKELCGGNATAEFVDRFVTEDGEYEDVWMSLKGHDEWKVVVKWMSRLVKWTVVTVRGEHHGPDRVTIDCTLDVMTNYLPWVFPIPMRANLLLRRDAASGGEKIHRYYEEMNGNQQLNRETTFAPLGVLHEKLRWYHGQLLAAIINAGIL